MRVQAPRPPEEKERIKSNQNQYIIINKKYSVRYFSLGAIGGRIVADVEGGEGEAMSIGQPNHIGHLGDRRHGLRRTKRVCVDDTA